MDAATPSFSARARRTSEMCPSCKYPIVGTNPSDPAERASSRARRNSPIVRINSKAISSPSVTDCMGEGEMGNKRAGGSRIISLLK